jgi:hypothetical protein
MVEKFFYYCTMGSTGLPGSEIHSGPLFGVKESNAIDE